MGFASLLLLLHSDGVRTLEALLLPTFAINAAELFLLRV
jgi:hypothetical protein